MSSMFPSSPWSTTLTILLSPVFFIVLWHLSTTSSSHFSSNHLRGKRICLLIAHPDDEAMFFSPTVIALSNPSLGNHVKILCLSTGNADGLGPTRKTELLASAMHLGLRKPADVFIIDDPSRFPDSMTRTWSATDIAALLSSAFVPATTFTSTNNTTTTTITKRSSKSSSTSDPPPHATIDTLITFDRHGVSRHPNHTSLHYGAVAFLRSLMKDREAWRCPVELYCLTSVSWLRKYAFVLDAPVTMVAGALDSFLFLPWRRSGKRRGADGDGGGRLLFVSGMTEYWTGRGAMVKSHRSQMVWFRWGWVALGRYMVVNDLRRFTP